MNKSLIIELSSVNHNYDYKLTLLILLDEFVDNNLRKN
jgi:hypothetical protein